MSAKSEYNYSSLKIVEVTIFVNISKFKCYLRSSAFVYFSTLESKFGLVKEKKKRL